MKSGQPLSLDALADLVSGDLSHPAKIEISGINDLENAEPEQASFLSDDRYLKQARASRAGVLLVRPGFSLEGKETPLIYCEEPSAAFSLLVDHFSPPSAPWSPGIHPTAVLPKEISIPDSCHIGPGVVIEERVSIGEKTFVGPGCVIGSGSKLGSECCLFANVVCREGTLLGDRVILQPGVVLGADGFGYQFKNDHHEKIPQRGWVQVDSDVEIGANTTVDRGRFGRTWIKEGTKIDNQVQIAHNVVVGPHAIIVSQCGLSGSSRLGAYVTMAGQSAVVGHVTVGDHITLTGWTAVTKDLTKPGVYRGGPARPMREAMKIEALTARLPELMQRIKALEETLSKHPR